MFTLTHRRDVAIMDNKERNQLVDKKLTELQTEIDEGNEQNLLFYVKNNCRHCYGRGKQTFSPVYGTETVKLCVCVVNKVKKEIDSLG